jgi:hypothetical protein
MRKFGGADGNARLTGTVGVVLIALLAVEGVTILFIRPLISMHVFVGLLLVPPVALKLASTGWRFARYYTRCPEYVTKGPPQFLLRVLVAPVVVASTLVVFGTGVAMLVVRPRAGQLVGLHKAAFIVWFVSTGIHVLAYLTRLPRLVLGDWRPSLRLPAARLRVGLVATSVVTGAIFAAATLADADDWITWASHRH